MDFGYFRLLAAHELFSGYYLNRPKRPEHTQQAAAKAVPVKEQDRYKYLLQITLGKYRKGKQGRLNTGTQNRWGPGSIRHQEAGGRRTSFRVVHIHGIFQR